MWTKDEYNDYRRKWRAENLDKVNAQMVRWRKKHPGHFRAYMNNYVKRRKLADPEFKFRHNMSRRFVKALRARGESKRGLSWEKLVGYSIDDLRAHLEAQFEWWMSWENHGHLWHVDHVQPLSSFPAGQIREAWALSNLRPICKHLNWWKAAK